MKWSGDDIVYLKEKNKESSKCLRRLNNIKKKVANNGPVRLTSGLFDRRYKLNRVTR